MSGLAVFAHFDPQGEVAPHVTRHLQELRRVVDQLVIVTTAELSDEARDVLRRHGDLIERTNEGYDFYSWKVGLDSVPEWHRVDHLLLANDSVVGPLVSYQTIMRRMAERGAAFWGVTRSMEVEPHLQSFVLGFGRDALRSPLLRAFWRSMVPLNRRAEVIAQYERGLSRLLNAAGLIGEPYFEPTWWDERVGRLRRARLTAVRNLDERRRDLLLAGAGRITPMRTLREARRELRRGMLIKETRQYLRRDAFYNPMISLWDRALDGRLPFVKIETLRDDPYRLGADRMLAACERAYPEQFAGVREHLRRTEADYDRLGRSRHRAGV